MNKSVASVDHLPSYHACTSHMLRLPEEVSSLESYHFAEDIYFTHELRILKTFGFPLSDLQCTPPTMVELSMMLIFQIRVLMIMHFRMLIAYSIAQDSILVNFSTVLHKITSTD